MLDIANIMILILFIMNILNDILSLYLLEIAQSQNWSQVDFFQWLFSFISPPPFFLTFLFINQLIILTFIWVVSVYDSVFLSTIDIHNGNEIVDSTKTTKDNQIL